MAVLVKRTGKLKLCQSFRVKTGPQRIAQIVTCREKEGDKRQVIIGNSHLSFPGGPCSIADSRRQAYEAHLIARAVAREGRHLSSLSEHHSHLQLIAGDFNSNSCALAAQSLEQKHGYVNCMSASALQTLSASMRANRARCHPFEPSWAAGVRRSYHGKFHSSGRLINARLRRSPSKDGIF